MTPQQLLSVLTPALLGAICVGLAGFVYRELNGVDTAADPLSPVAAGMIQQLAPEGTFAMAPIEKFSAIIERPVFSANRRPVSQQAGSQKQLQRAQSKFTLYGIAISAGQRIALVGMERGTGLIRVKEGDALAGWVVVDIERTRLLLRQGALDEELELNYGALPPRK
jgi:hypothetical protein